MRQVLGDHMPPKGSSCSRQREGEWMMMTRYAVVVQSAEGGRGQDRSLEAVKAALWMMLWV